MPIFEPVSRPVAAKHTSSAVTYGIRAGLAMALGFFAVNAMSQPATPEVIEVREGDTFSSIAARVSDEPRNWRKMYRSNLSRLPNPNLISVGMLFAVAEDTKGRRYLRLVQANESTANPAVATAPAPTTPPATPAAVPPATSSVTATAPVLPGVAPRSGVLVIGVLPNIPAATLTTQYQHLSRYLERADGQKVRIVISTNFKEFFESTMKGDFDLAVTAPHFARIAQLDRSMIPLVSYQPRINALLVAPIDSKVVGSRDLRERAVAFANPQSLVAMYGQQWLSKQGLEPGTDYEVKGTRTDLGVGRMVLSGDAVAAILSNGEFRALPPEESVRMKIVEVIARIPNFVVLAHPRVDRARQGQIKAQLKSFLADPEDGVPFAQATGFTGMTDVDEAQLRELDSFVETTRRSMGYSN